MLSHRLIRNQFKKLNPNKKAEVSECRRCASPYQVSTVQRSCSGSQSNATFPRASAHEVQTICPCHQDPHLLSSCPYLKLCFFFTSPSLPPWIQGSASFLCSFLSQLCCLPNLKYYLSPCLPGSSCQPPPNFKIPCIYCKVCKKPLSHYI